MKRETILVKEVGEKDQVENKEDDIMKGLKERKERVQLVKK